MVNPNIILVTYKYCFFVLNTVLILFCFEQNKEIPETQNYSIVFNVHSLIKLNQIHVQKEIFVKNENPEKFKIFKR